MFATSRVCDVCDSVKAGTFHSRRVLPDRTTRLRKGSRKQSPGRSQSFFRPSFVRILDDSGEVLFRVKKMSVQRAQRYIPAKPNDKITVDTRLVINRLLSPKGQLDHPLQAPSALVLEPSDTGSFAISMQIRRATRRLGCLFEWTIAKDSAPSICMSHITLCKYNERTLIQLSNTPSLRTGLRYLHCAD